MYFELGSGVTAGQSVGLPTVFQLSASGADILGFEAIHRGNLSTLTWGDFD